MTSSSNGGRRSSQMPWKPDSGTERKIFPMFSRWKILCTPGIRSAAVISIPTMRPLAMVASTGTAYSVPGKWKSDVYCAVPVTFKGPSTRGVSRPIGGAVGVVWGEAVVAMVLVRSGRHGQVEGMGEAPLGQFDLECVLALRLGIAQGYVCCRAKRLRGGRPADKRGFGLGRAPGLGAHAPQRNARLAYLAARNRDHHRRRCQGELVGRAIAQLQVDLPCAASLRNRGARKRHMGDEIARLEDRLAVRS